MLASAREASRGGAEGGEARLLGHVGEDVFDVAVAEGLALVEGDAGDVAWVGGEGGGSAGEGGWLARGKRKGLTGAKGVGGRGEREHADEGEHEHERSADHRGGRWRGDEGVCCSESSSGGKGGVRERREARERERWSIGPRKIPNPRAMARPQQPVGRREQRLVSPLPSDASLPPLLLRDQPFSSPLSHQHPPSHRWPRSPPSRPRAHGACPSPSCPHPLHPPPAPTSTSAQTTTSTATTRSAASRSSSTRRSSASRPRMSASSAAGRPSGPSLPPPPLAPLLPLGVARR